jgi:4-hydroxy-2-oxoheptanedioate aldolase
MLTNKTKTKLKAGETVIGCLTRSTEANLIEFLGYQGWDFVLFDSEHGYLQPADCENMVRALEKHDTTSIVRVTSNVPYIILRFMDTGVQGVMVPQVNSAQEAESAMQALKYAPRGKRGLAGVRAAGFMQEQTFTEYVERANAETLTILQVESQESVNNLEEILKVTDIDVLFVGRADLSQSLGYPGQAQHPTVQAAVDKILEVTLKTDVAVGMLVKNAEEARYWQERGVRLLAITLDNLIGPACRSFLADARQEEEGGTHENY